MKVGIDVLGCNETQSGLGSYILNFIRNIPENCDIEFELFGDEQDRYTYTTNNEFSYVSVNVPESLLGQRLWHKRKIKKFLKKQKYDLVFFPSAEYVIPKKCKNKSVVVVNSLLSKRFSFENKKYIKQLKQGLQHCTAILVPSECVKEDLNKIGIKENIYMVHNGIDHNMFYPIAGLSDDFIQVSPFAIKRPYFIYPTRLTGNDKNHDVLIKAFDLYKKNTGLPHRLVIAGDFSNSVYSERIQKLAYQSEFSSDIFLLGHFPHESLPILFCGADACIFPSDIEGVGMPVLESMACGIPVLCSSAGALKEIAGVGPKYFNSKDPVEIADLMQDVVENPQMRNKMIDKGFKRCSVFSWNETVDKTLEIMKKI